MKMIITYKVELDVNLDYYPEGVKTAKQVEDFEKENDGCYELLVS